MALFKRNAAYTTSTVKAKLAAADAEIAEAQRQLQDAALAGALDDTDLRADIASAELARLSQRRVVLIAALAAAEQAEAAEAARKLAAARAAQNRAIRQQIAQMVKHATAYQSATAEAVAAWRKLVETGDRIRRLLPPGSGPVEWLSHAVMPNHLRALGEAEIGRVGAAEPLIDDPGSSAPGARWEHGLPNGAYIKQLRPLSERLEAELLGFFRQLTGEPAVAVPETRSGEGKTHPLNVVGPGTVAVTAGGRGTLEAEAVPVPTDGDTAPTAAPAGPTSAPAAHRPPAPNPHPEGSPEAAQYAAALDHIARLRTRR